MAITNAQQARQLYKNGSMKKIKGQNHMLAYITPGERDMLVDLGGQETMTKEGILAYPPGGGDWGGSMSESGGGGGGRDRDNDGGDGQSMQDYMTEQTTPERFSISNEEAERAIRNNESLRQGIANAAAEKERQRIAAEKERQRIAAETEKARLALIEKEKKEKELSELGFDKTSKFGTPIAKPKKTKYNSTTPNIFEQYLRNNLLTKTTEAITNSDFAYNLNAIQREKFLEKLQEDDPTRYAEVMQDLGTMGYATNIGPVDIKMGIGPKFKDLGEPQAKAILEGGRKVNIDPKDPTGETYDLSTDYTDYLDRSNTTDNTGGGGDNYVPPIVVKKDDTDDDDDDTTTPTRNFGGLAPRFMGSIFDFSGLADGGRAEMMDGGMMKMKKEYRDLLEEDEMEDPTGGIMDLETGRQQYFLGKLVKKATRAIKKVAKSPFGKAALLGLGAGMAGFGPASGLFGSGKGLAFKQMLMGSVKPGGMGNKTGGLFNFIKDNPYKSIFGGSALLGLMGQKEEDDGMDLDEYYKTQGIDIDAIRNNPNRILARRFMAEGGDAEPVAKETMPLLDMDNQEMDLRAEGGFVPIGRMERADDVPARLSKNEFVFTADAVRNAGEGDIDKGAEVMYNMMKNLESGGEVSEESQGLDGAREMFQTSQRLEEVL